MDSLNSASYQIHYSDIGKKLTGPVLESRNAEAHSDANLASCLEQIALNSSTTEDEKLLARIGTSLTDKVPEPERQAVRLCVLNAINRAVPGPLGAVYAGLLGDASSSIGQMWERDMLRLAAFKSLSQHPGAAPDVREFAGFVEKRVSIGAQTVTILEKAHQAALKLLSAPLPGPIQSLCVNYILEQEKPVAGLAYGMSMLHAGLRHFYDNPDSPPGRHELAKSGLMLPNMDIDNDDNIDQIRRSYLNALAHEESDYLPGTVAGETLLHLDDVKKPEGKSYVLREVFRAIRENPDSTELHRTLAIGGENLSKSNLDPGRLLNSQKAVMEAIAALPEKPSNELFIELIGRLRERLDGSNTYLDQLFSAEILTHEDASGPEITSDGDYIYIDGLRLERNREEPKEGGSFAFLTGRLVRIKRAK